MNSSDIQQHIASAEEALQSFLGMLLGEDVVFHADSPEQVTFAEANLKKMASLVVLGPGGKDGGFAVLLDPAWLPSLSKAMLGEAMEMADDGADDLMRELAGQGYGSIRNQLGGEGVTLPDATFEILPHGDMITANALPDTLWRVSFAATLGAQKLGGVAFLSAATDAQTGARPQPAPASAAAASAAMPQPQAQPMGGGAASGIAGLGAQVSVAPAMFPELGTEVIRGNGENFNLLAEVELEVTVELGRRKLTLSDVLRLTTGSVIELENLVGEPLEVYANGRLIAEGEAVVIDEQFGIRITRLASDRQRTKAFL